MPVNVESQHLVLRWAHTTRKQVSRLRNGRDAVVKVSRARQDGGTYTVQDSWPFMELEGDKFFLMMAARQLVRALRAFDDDLRLPEGLTNKQVWLLRNALEHWDRPDGEAMTEMRKRGLDPTSHQWGVDGSGVLGQLVEDDALLEWAERVYAEFSVMDIWRN